jgi:hypothetical protein
MGVWDDLQLVEEFGGAETRAWRDRAIRAEGQFDLLRDLYGELLADVVDEAASGARTARRRLRAI